jgi:putative DNA primase/helicase
MRIAKHHLKNQEIGKPRTPSEGGGEDKKPIPKIMKVTKALIANVIAAIESECFVPSRLETPCWLPKTPDEVYAANATKAPPDPNPLRCCPTRSGIVLLDRFADGTNTGIIPSTPRLFSFNSLNFEADESAPEPTQWLEFLEQLWPGDAESKQLLQQWFGYLISPDTSQQKILFVIGPPRAGKGTIMRILRSLVGSSNCCAPTLGSLATPFGLAPLLGKSVAVVEDARVGPHQDLATICERLLTISGEGELTIDRKFKPAINIKLGLRFAIVSNEIPRIEDASNALSSRFSTIKLARSFRGQEDLGLAERLNTELPGIFRWAVAGWRDLQQQGRFIRPAASVEIEKETEEIGSPIQAFVNARCQIDADGRVSKEDLWNEYKDWCKDEERKPRHRTWFFRDLKSAVPGIVEIRGGSDGGRSQSLEGLTIRSSSNSTYVNGNDVNELLANGES